jgi:hypothetical protein
MFYELCYIPAVCACMKSSGTDLSDLKTYEH